MELQEQVKYILKTQVGIEKFETIQLGELFPITEDLAETKDFWNGSLAYLKPTVHFSNQDKLLYSLELKPTAKGFSATAIRNGFKYGCNFNRVRNRKNRWAITVWNERLSQDKKAS